jgi:ABC-type transport system involved in multi-copper enzyme maturation permease subunit
VQTFALLLDSWRLLVSRRLFWLTLALNVLVVVLYGSLAITENGVSIGFGLWEIESERFRMGTGLAQSTLLPFINYMLISFWLAWIATGLGLISTASIFPDFLADGAVDMVLAKPISRAKIFIVKYLGGLLFVTLQVSLFCIASFFVARWRIGEWQWMLFAAIPVVVVFFSYLYAVSVLIGVLTRSSIAAILGAAIFWLCLWAVQGAEKIAHNVAIGFDVRTELQERMLARDEAELAEMTARGVGREDNKFERLRGQIETDRTELASAQEYTDTAETWHFWLYGLTSVAPKTQATIGLLDRWFAGENQDTTLTQMLMSTSNRREERLREFAEGHVPKDDRELERMSEVVAQERMMEAEAARPIEWVIGTSLLFEVFVVLIALGVFVRRDF